MQTHPFAPLEKSRVDITIQLQQTPRSRNNTLIVTLPVLDQVAKQIFVHTPRLSPADFANGVDARSDNLGAHTRVHEFIGEFLNDWGEDVWRREVVYGLGEGDEDDGYSELVVC